MNDKPRITITVAMRFRYPPSFLLSRPSTSLRLRTKRRHFDGPVSGELAINFSSTPRSFASRDSTGENEHRHCLSRTLLLFSTDRRRQKKAKRAKRGARTECTRACGITCAWETCARTLRCLIDWGWQTRDSRRHPRVSPHPRDVDQKYSRTTKGKKPVSQQLYFFPDSSLSLSPFLAVLRDRIL